MSVTVRGTLGKEGPFTPDRVADAIWDAAHQDESEWRDEVPYSGWMRLEPRTGPRSA